MFTPALLMVMITAAPPGLIYLASSQTDINGLSMGNCQALGLNSRSEFVIPDPHNNRVIFFDTTGNHVYNFNLADEHQNPFGIAVAASGEIVLSAMDKSELWIYSDGGQFLNTIALPSDIYPGRIAVDSAENLYVVDRAGSGLIKLSITGETKARYTVEDKSVKPSGVCLDNESNIILISSQGPVWFEFGSGPEAAVMHGEHGRKPEDFSHPTNAIFDKNDLLWIVDSFRHQIKRFNPEGIYLDFFGNQGTGPGEFYFPVDLRITSTGILGVLEKGNGRLQLFRVNYDK